MSGWLSPAGGLLKSLENALEKVDSAASSTLKKDSDDSQSKTSNLPSSKQNLFSTPLKASSTITRTNSNSPASTPTPLRDEDIFDFLNAPMREAQQEREREKAKKTQQALATKKAKEPVSISHNHNRTDTASKLREQVAPTKLAPSTTTNTTISSSPHTPPLQNSPRTPVDENDLVHEQPPHQPPHSAREVGHESTDGEPATQQTDDSENESTTQLQPHTDVAPEQQPQTPTAAESVPSSDQENLSQSRDSLNGGEESAKPNGTESIQDDNNENSVSEEPTEADRREEEYEELTNRNSDLQLENKLYATPTLTTDTSTHGTAHL
jgi:hypothetical protein